MADTLYPRRGFLETVGAGAVAFGGAAAIAAAPSRKKWEPVSDRKIKFGVAMPCDRSGMTGYTVRVLPQHPGLGDPLEMGLVRWV